MSPNKINRPLRRTAALLCAALAGLGLAGRAAAQTATGPLATSPPTPTPFQSPLYHSGGASTPYPLAAPYITPLIDPLQGQLQGTPTELYPPTAAGSLTQIPSYLLGNYDPTRPPTGLQADGINVYYPNHFGDGNMNGWTAPFSYVAQSATTVSVDDNAAAPTAGVSGFTANGFASVTDPVAFPAAGTATNGEYLRLLVGTTTSGSAVWTLYQPTAGNYSVYFHIPNDLPSGATPPVPEPRPTQVTYFVAVRDANGNVTNSTTATASQTEANSSQFLAGPFQVAAGGTVTVTLSQGGNVNYFPGDYLVADSMTLQSVIGDVQSAPTAITRDRYLSDFSSTAHPLQYWGIFVPPASDLTATGGQQTVGTTVNSNANPDTTGAAYGAAAINNGTVLLHTGSQTDSLRLIRQLVYFGRADPSASVSNSLDDSQTEAGFTGSGTTVNNPTASNGEYKSSPTSTGTTLAGPVATWTVPIPAAGAGTSFFVYAHIPATPTGERRLSRVFYHVTVTTATGPVTYTASISQMTQGADALVALPTGSLIPIAGSSIVVEMYNVNGLTTPTNGAVVVADSVTVSTGTGQGAIYCVNGFNGEVVWRFETPGSANGASAPVFASPAVVKINVMVTPPGYTNGVVTTPAVYANRLVVIVGDNNGLVYCLDAIGNGDGTSNVNVLAKDVNGNPISGQPVTIPQPPYVAGAYGAAATPLAAGTLAGNAAGTTGAAATVHVGTTGVYWIYRPDANQPKYVTGPNIGKVKSIDPTTDLPVPAAFNTASPNVFVDPTVNTAAPTASNAIVYIGNSNGVLYALDAGGVGIDGTSAATFAGTGDTFNVSQDLQGGPFPKTEVPVPSAQPLWWFSLRGPDPNSADNASSADIESAPAIYVKTVTTTTPGTPPVTTTTVVPTVYVGSAHEMESTSNVGRLYALNGLYGPSGNNGRTSPTTQPLPASANYTGPGSFNYNLGQRPQISKTDTADWSFPDAVGADNYSVGKSSNGKPRPALGNMTGSPVVFTNLDETNAANVNADGSSRQTRIYIAADSGQEYPAPVRPDDTQTGRIWAVNLDGSVGTTTNSTTGVWAYPLANDPNDATLDKVAEPFAPIGSFLRGTPAIGFVQFPAVIDLNGGAVYAPTDAVGGLKGRSVPMLYIGTRGVNDTALYALDIDGAMTTGSDQRTIYRLVSPDGSIYQSSPALVTNASSTGGNGGSVYAVAGNTLYDYGATPISNPFVETFPLIRENAHFAGFGPISSPALAGANVSDLPSAQTFLATVPGTVGQSNTSGFTSLTTDYIYVGDSSSGYCRGITPTDASYGGIPTELGQIIPPNVNAPNMELLSALMQTFLVPLQTSRSFSDAEPIGAGTSLSVFEWGQSVFARFSNAVPPNPINAATGKPDPALFVHDTRQYADLTQASSANPIPFYTSDGTTTQTIHFDVADADTVNSSGQGQLFVQPRLITTPPDGFVVATGTLPASFAASAPVTTNLTANNGNKYLGTYTYTIADGTALPDTPGARRKFQDVKQLVNVWNFTNSTGDGDVNNINNYQQNGTTIIAGDATNQNIVSEKHVDPVTKVVTYGFDPNSAIPAIDQPTFGILNPLAARGGGVNLLTPTPPGTVNAALPVGDGLGPFRGVATTLSNPPTLDVQALTNGNAVPTFVPPSSSGVGGNPTLLPLAGTPSDPTGINAPTNTAVVVTATGLIPDNTTGDNGDTEGTLAYPTGIYSNSSTDGLTAGAPFGGYALDVFDRSALYNLGQTLRVKMGVPDPGTLFAPPAGRDGLYWNANVGPNATLPDTTGHDSVVNFLPWETAPTPYGIGGANGSQDYPDIAPGSLVANAQNVTTTGGGTLNSGGNLTSNNVTLPPAIAGTATDTVQSRTVTGTPVQVQISVPNHQPANQQLYQQAALTTGQAYNVSGQIPPVDANGNSQITLKDAVPMGYVTVKRLYVPDINGNYNSQRAYRDVRVYTGVPVDMKTSIANSTTEIGQVLPAAFGVQTEQDANINPAQPQTGLFPGLFTPYNPDFQAYFKPLAIHNDGNVNLLNVSLDQKYSFGGYSGSLPLTSDTADPLSTISGYDIPPAGSQFGVTGPRTPTMIGGSVPEQPYLIRSTIDTDLVHTYDRNPFIAANYGATYPGVTFHKPPVGSGQSSILNVPDSPENYVPGASVPPSPNGLPQPGFSAPPYVGLAVPFGTPVGTYHTAPAQDPTSLRLFEGLDTAAATGYSLTTPANSPIPRYLYPPQYGKAVGGIGSPAVDTTTANTGEPVDSSNQPEDVYNGAQPISTTGTQLVGTVVEQRLTDGATYGAVPMIDAGSAGPSVVPTGGNTAVPTSTADIAPAAFRDPATGNLSVYWTSARSGNGFNIYGANLPFMPDPATNDPKHGHFMPGNPAGQWWNPFTPALAAGVNSGLSVTPGTGTSAFDVAVSSTSPYSNTLYSYSVSPATGALSNQQAITSDPSQVKYGVKGLDTGFTNPLWAFWTASTRGRTAIGYNSQDSSGKWLATTGLLPVPAGLTAVADASPMLMSAPVTVNGTTAQTNTIEVTYSGTAPDGNVDLYVSRYLPEGTTAATASKLDLVPFPVVTENLRSAPGGWYQSRDVAWSRTGALNVTVPVANSAGAVTQQPLLYNGNTPLFTKAIYDKASGLLVLTGVHVPFATVPSSGPTFTTNTVYVDAATGRVRFSPALLSATTQNFAQIRATFSPLARRLTEDSRADTAPVTFLDTAQKANDDPTLANGPAPFAQIEADRRWTIWRKSGVSTVPGSASLYYKTQRLTAYLPSAVDTTKTLTVTLNGTAYTGGVDVENIPAVYNDAVQGQTPTVKYPASAHLYFPIASGAEGAAFSVTYTPLGGGAAVTSPVSPATDTVEWQDYLSATDPNAVPFTNSIDALDAISPGYGVPMNTATNENNVAAFLDPFASATSSHKVWLFWNSTRNGTEDIYSETFDPRFAPGP